MKTREELVSFVSSLILDGQEVESGRISVDRGLAEYEIFVDLRKFSEWQSSCRLLIYNLRSFGEPWRHVLGSDTVANSLANAQQMLGALRSIAANLQAGRLVKIEELVNANTFANLIEQAEHLLDKNYHIAAGVLFRAVLEENLRNLCDREGCMPSKNKPTLGDYNSELYGAKFYNKITMKNVDAMAAIGNAAAHNENPSIDDVRQLHNNLLAFLQKIGT